MTRRVDYTPEALDDLKRLFSFLEERDQECALRAHKAIERSLDAMCTFPWSCRQAAVDDSSVRELVIEFGRSGFVCLFWIANDEQIWVLGLRHQRQQDYYY